jgi:hypothetical protein
MLLNRRKPLKLALSCYASIVWVLAESALVPRIAFSMHILPRDRSWEPAWPAKRRIQRQDRSSVLALHVKRPDCDWWEIEMSA